MTAAIDKFFANPFSVIEIIVFKVTSTRPHVGAQFTVIWSFY
jgi:hypothetical protein